MSPRWETVDTERISECREYVLANHGTGVSNSRIGTLLARADRIIQDTGPLDGGAYELVDEDLRAGAKPA